MIKRADRRRQDKQYGLTARLTQLRAQLDYTTQVAASLQLLCDAALAITKTAGMGQVEIDVVWYHVHQLRTQAEAWRFAAVQHRQELWKLGARTHSEIALA